MPAANRLRLVSLFAALLVPCAAGQSAAGDEPAASETQRPNIIVIMADDMGFADLGCYGGEIETPHLDRLAAGGIRFTQFYNTARCCPTRAALLTGVYQHAAGIGHMTGNYGIPSYQGYLNNQTVTLAEALRPAGYTTLMAGKWHVGSSPDKWPLQRGFDRYMGTPSGGGVYFKDTLALRKTVFFVQDNERIELPDDFYVTDTFTDYAMEFVDDALQGKKPFFLYLAHIAPHFPIQAKPEDIEKYDGRYAKGWDTLRQARYDRQVKMGLISKQHALSPRDGQAKPWKSLSAERQRALANRMEIYAGQVDCLDQNIGRLVELLRTRDALDNTVIMFLSDNGCSAEGGPGGFDRGIKGAPLGSGKSYASLGLEWANVCDTPFRKYKMSVHEGGIATPLIVHWPRGLNRPGELERTPGHVVDLMPTCLDLAGATYPNRRAGKPTLPVAGKSLLPALGGKPIQRDALYWEHQGNQAIRAGDWKLVRPHGKPWELYDLSKDRTELHDLARDQPDRVKTLASKWKAWADATGVEPWPVRRKRNR